ncbi:hypothetical protein CLOL250_01409 [Clostridium sp. L2-50]|nr:hypothetical protein CLOL250_01409 [Clostridium sp. L2-50]
MVCTQISDSRIGEESWLLKRESVVKKYSLDKKQVT